MIDDEYPWYVRMYYADDHPMSPGKVAQETIHKTEEAMRLEIQAAHDNDDIDEVEYGKRFRLV